jgi:hypothetical protein
VACAQKSLSLSNVTHIDAYFGSAQTIIHNVKESNERLSNIGACNTASLPPNINPTDEANAPLI